MGFLDHLEELRTRIIRACIAIAVGMAFAFVFVDRIADFVEASVLQVLPTGTALVFIRPGEAFSFYLDSRSSVGRAGRPVRDYQVWAFIAPGLYAKEKRLVVPFLALTTVGTLGGALFSHYVLFPAMMAFFGTFNSPKMKFMPRVEDTFDLYKTTMLGMVAVFQLPTLVYFLAKNGPRHRGIPLAAYQVCRAGDLHHGCGLDAVSDPWNQTVFAAPMMALYIISIGVAWLVSPKRDRHAEPAGGSTTLRLVVGAMVVDQARGQRLRPHKRM